MLNWDDPLAQFNEPTPPVSMQNNTEDTTQEVAQHPHAGDGIVGRCSSAAPVS